MRMVIPLCYPDNYVWKSSEGVLEKKRERRGKLVVCEDAINFLRSIDGPICPVSVTGPARCGKSYIASQLIEPRPQDCVFKTSNKQKPETMGIWISTEVSKKTKNQTEMSVVTMDTEGLGAYNAYNDNDMQLFLLVTLLSSVLVYNTNGTVTAEDMKQLSWVSTISDMIHGEKDGKTSKCREEDFIRFFPNFMWLFRDVTKSFTLERGGKEKEVALKDYILEEVLKLEDETPGSTKECDRYRRAVLKSFPVFDAAKLPIPASDTEVLANMDKGAYRNRLNPTFLSEVDDLVGRCDKLMKPKKAWPYDGNINGPQFAELLEQYVAAFSSSGGALQINKVSDKAMETLLGEVQKKALDNYKSNTATFAGSALPCDTQEVINAHRKYRLKAMGIFEQNSEYINDAKRLHSYRKSLKDSMATFGKDDSSKCSGGYLNVILQSNKKKSEAFCRTLVENLVEKELRPLLEADSSKNEINLKVNELEKLYRAKARGPCKWNIYKADFARKVNTVLSTFKDIKKEEEEELKEKEKEREEIRTVNLKEEETLRKNLEEDVTKQEKQVVDDCKETCEAILTQINQLRKTHDTLVKELEGIRNKLDEGTKRVLEELNRQKNTES
ncbi:guanylate-binding protein 2-like isoform X2 [Ptychodera flava]|uniref:guanylate-binding protein 2-like isoform X2 n=1 Tax=Ptychodera flava TaxID=63121 RepID=UPI00396A98FA